MQNTVTVCFSLSFVSLMQFAVKIDQVEDFLKNAQEFDNIDSLRELLLQQEHHTKGTNSIPLLMASGCVLTS